MDFDFVPTVDEVHLTGYAGQENSEVYIGYCVKDVDNETMPVEISQVEVIAITSNSAKVIWKTDVYSTSQVELRDEFTGWVYMGRLDPQLVRNHMVDLTELGLRSNSLYTIRVMSAIEGDPTISDPVSFRTRR